MLNSLSWGRIYSKNKKRISSTADIQNYVDLLAYFKTYHIRRASVFDKFVHKVYSKKHVKGNVNKFS